MSETDDFVDVSALCDKYGFNDPDCFSDCPPGWASILERLLTILAPHAENIHISQIKEKMAGLRVYYSSTDSVDDDWIDICISTAEDACYNTCQDCGSQPAKQVHAGWWYTWCERCHQAYLKRKSNMP